MGLIVVGVDGSEEAGAALRFAAAEAAIRGATLRVVCAWHVPAAALSAGWTPSVDMASGFAAGAQEVLEQAVAEVSGLHPEVTVEERVVEGEAADVILEEAEGADLLVVGSRGLTGFKSFLLGSVSQHVVHHAACPVVIVPHGAPIVPPHDRTQPG